MSFLRVLQRSQAANVCSRARRFYVTASKPAEANAGTSSIPEKTAASAPATGESTSKSCCPENMVLEGIAYLKGQAPVLAKADDEYPPWLWKLLDPKVIPDDGPGGKAERVALRKANRQRIRDQNFMKTQ